jgi:hypothetical protein
MPTLHDDACRTSLERRFRALRPDAERRWGRMTVDQMLWHVNGGLAVSLGRMDPGDEKTPPLPPALLRFLVLHLPWPRGAPTLKAITASGERYDFEAERVRCLELMSDFARKPLESAWPSHPAFGDVTGTFVSRLQARHLDHHLKQFGV